MMQMMLELSMHAFPVEMSLEGRLRDWGLNLEVIPGLPFSIWRLFNTECLIYNLCTRALASHGAAACYS